MLLLPVGGQYPLIYSSKYDTSKFMHIKVRAESRKVQGGRDCGRVEYLRECLDSLLVKFHFGQPSFGFEETKISFPLETFVQVFSFENFFRNIHEHIGEEAEVDLIEGHPEAQHINLVKKLSMDDEYARIVGASSNTLYDNDFPFVADSM